MSFGQIPQFETQANRAINFVRRACTIVGLPEIRVGYAFTGLLELSTTFESASDPVFRSLFNN